MTDNTELMNVLREEFARLNRRFDEADRWRSTRAGPAVPEPFPNPGTPANRDGTPWYCSFCGKSQHEVSQLIAGPTVFICNECVDLCTDIIRERREKMLNTAIQAADKQEPSP
jgi:hypothetical protein